MHGLIQSSLHVHLCYILFKKTLHLCSLTYIADVDVMCIGRSASCGFNGLCPWLSCYIKGKTAMDDQSTIEAELLRRLEGTDVLNVYMIVKFARWKKLNMSRRWPIDLNSCN